MMPLILKIRKELHKGIAQAQDLIIQEMYSVIDNAVFHGGTAIWRCYKGNRFSEDIDIYLPRDIEKINRLFSRLEKAGFSIEKKKITENSVYSSLMFNRTHVRLEATFRKAKGVLKEYETVEGNLISVYTFTPEGFVNEKVNAYLGRRKIRDLYDIFFLMRHVQDKDMIKSSIKRLTAEYKPPLDEKDLKVIILEGLVPTSEKMIEYIRNIRWENKNT